MPDQPTQPNAAPEEADWNPALPARIPEPTIWPAALALASTLMLWGLTSSLILSWVGLGFFIISLTGWIREIRHERKQS